MKRKEKHNPGRLLSIVLCLAAALGGAWLCLLNTVLPRVRTEPGTKAPALEAASVPEHAETIFAVPEVTATPEESAAPAVRQDGGEEAPASEPVLSPQASRPSVSTTREPEQKGAKKKELDLSAYRVKAHSSEGETFLPRDTSLSAEDLNAQLKGEKSKKGKGFDGGKGLIGDIYRGGKRLLDSMDATTLDAAQRVLGNVARPEKAKLRPSGDGVRLKIEIPPETVKIGR
ncbi:MAG: hypothetical protein K6E38_02160 [Fretibacterium sp.]|nr:hypothetical protein [Fretibacterium sp.]